MPTLGQTEQWNQWRKVVPLRLAALYLGGCRRVVRSKGICKASLHMTLDYRRDLPKTFDAEEGGRSPDLRLHVTSAKRIRCPKMGSGWFRKFPVTTRRTWSDPSSIAVRSMRDFSGICIIGLGKGKFRSSFEVVSQNFLLVTSMTADACYSLEEMRFMG